MSKVSVSYFDNFKGDNVIEFAGNSDGLKHFLKFLEEVSKHPIGSSVDLCEEPHFKIRPDLKMNMFVVETSPGMFRSGLCFEWRMTIGKIQELCDLIKVVAKADFPCHHYLDFDESSDIVVIVSNGESTSTCL